METEEVTLAYGRAAVTGGTSLTIVCLVGILCYYRARTRMREALLGSPARSEKFVDSKRSMEMVVWVPNSPTPLSLAEHFRSVWEGMAPSYKVASERKLSAGDEGAASGAGDAADRFSAQIGELVTGQPQDAALGVMHYMGLRNAQELLLSMSKGVDAIRAEFDALLAKTNARVLEAASADADAQRQAVEAYERAQEAHECMRYVLDQRAGSSPLLFPNARHPRDCDAKGALRSDRRGEDGEGMRLADFLETRAARIAMLELPHVAAIRIYTTMAYRVLNEPLRDRARAMADAAFVDAAPVEAAPHPLPVTISFLTAALGKLRAVGATEDAKAQIDLWRGMRDVTVPDAFIRDGGTELAPMSTTTSLQMALQYALSSCPLLFKLRTDSFMVRGVSIECFSAYPEEAEVLYPPLTYLRASGLDETIDLGGRSVRVVEVMPHFGSS